MDRKRFKSAHEGMQFTPIKNVTPLIVSGRYGSRQLRDTFRKTWFALYPHSWTSVILSGAQQLLRRHCRTFNMPWTASTTTGPSSRRPVSENMVQKGFLSHGSTRSSITLNISLHLALQMACARRSRSRCTSALSRNLGAGPVASRHWVKFYLQTNASVSLPLSEGLSNIAG